MTLDLGKVDVNHLTSALDALGLNPRTRPNGVVFFNGGTYHPNVGQITVREGEEGIVEKIKQRYTLELTKVQARKAGWQVKEVAPNKLQLLKR